MEKLKVIVISNENRKIEKFLEKINEFFEDVTIIQDTDEIGEFDILFINEYFFGKKKSMSMYETITQDTGKVCFLLGSNQVVARTQPEVPSDINYITNEINEFDLIMKLIDELNNFNFNKQLRRQKNYDYLYFVTDRLQIIKAQYDVINEIFYEDRNVYLVLSNTESILKIINIKFSLIFNLLSQDFMKTEFNCIENMSLRRKKNKKIVSYINTLLNVHLLFTTFELKFFQRL